MLLDTHQTRSTSILQLKNSDERKKRLYLLSMGCLKMDISDQYFTALKVVKETSRSGENTRAGSYRFGFNGMEADDEIAGTKNSYTTHFRQYDPRVGRWWSVDPKDKLAPWESPFAAFANIPTLATDPKGDFVPIIIAGVYLSAEAVALLAATTTVAVTASIYHEEIAETGRAISDAIHDKISYERPENYYPTDWKYYDAARNPNNPMFDPKKINKWGKIVLGGTLVSDFAKHMIEDIKVNMPKSDIKNTRVEIRSLTPEQTVDDILNEEVTVKVEYDIYYKVQEGDNLTKIAKQYNTTVDELVKMNVIENENSIEAGESLKVGTGEYTTATDDFEYEEE